MPRSSSVGSSEIMGVAQAIPTMYPKGVDVMAVTQNGSLSAAEQALQSIQRQQEILERRKQVISSTGLALEYARDAEAKSDSVSEKREFAKAIKILEAQINSSSASIIDVAALAPKSRSGESSGDHPEGVQPLQQNAITPRRAHRTRVVEIPPPPSVEPTSDAPAVKPKKKRHIAVSGQHNAVVKLLFAGKKLPKSIAELCEVYGENWRQTMFCIYDKGPKKLPLGEIIGTPYEAQFCKGLVTSFETVASFGRGDFDQAIASGDMVLERHVDDIWKTKTRQSATIRRALEAMGCYPPKVADPA